MRRLLLGLAAIGLVLSACSDDGTEDEAATNDIELETPGSTIEADGATEPDGSDEPGTDDDGADRTAYAAQLTGAAEVPGPGNEDARGRAEARLEDLGVLCFDIQIADLGSEVTAAHVHDGAAGEAGGVVFGIGTPTTEVEGRAEWTDVCVEATEDDLTAIAADPGGFYVNVHTADFPDGAVRGQLEPISVADLSIS